MYNEIYDEIGGLVRSSADEKWWSLTDLVKFYRPDYSEREAVEQIELLRIYAHKDSHFDMAPWGDLSQNYSWCLGVKKEYLLSIILVLGGKKAMRTWSQIFLRVGYENESEEQWDTLVNNYNTSMWPEVGESLRYFREKLGVSIREIANVVGVSGATIRNLENGIPVMQPDLLWNACYDFLSYLEPKQDRESKRLLNCMGQST